MEWYSRGPREDAGPPSPPGNITYGVRLYAK